MKEYHMDSFAMNVLDIGVCYLGFTWEELGLSKPSDVEIDCTALLDDMLDGGIFGQNDMNRVHSANITLNAAENESVNAASGIWLLYFQEGIYQDELSIFKELSVLLPVAYLHRIFKYLTHRNTDAINTGEKAVHRLGWNVSNY